MPSNARSKKEVLSKNIKWFYGIGLAFVLLNTVLMYLEVFWFNLLPAALLIILFSLLSLDRLLMVIVFFTPLAINLEDMEGGFGLSLPTEPLMFGAMCIFLLRSLWEGSYNKAVLKHPVTIAILVNLGWMFITCFTSEMPEVSFKFFLSRLWFVTTFYFLATILFKEEKKIKSFLWYYIVPLGIVILYTLARHGSFHFQEDPAHWVMQPFYKDHTSYGALIAMYFPIIIAFLLMKKVSFNAKMIIVFVLGLFTVGLIMSYTRAAWVSLVGVAGILAVIKMKIKVQYLLLAFLAVVIGFLSFQDELMYKLAKNKQDSSGDFAEHVQSISNVASDASNLERINRWNCALRMFEERPVFGWGPGTYMFQYAPFQHSSELTIISTNFGNKGNAHSEYLGPLSESGVLGSLTLLAVFLLVIWRGVRVMQSPIDHDLRILAGACLLGLCTYFIHGILNNFLDTDKASVPVWGMIAVIVAIDVFQVKSLKATSKQGDVV